jgi:homoserine dehydrogenase
LTRDKISIGIIGFGTVGSGTVKILLDNQGILRERTGFDLILRRISDLDVSRDRGVRLPEGILSTNADDILGDPEIDIVVELIRQKILLSGRSGMENRL